MRRPANMVTMHAGRHGVVVAPDASKGEEHFTVDAEHGNDEAEDEHDEWQEDWWHPPCSHLWQHCWHPPCFRCRSATTHRGRSQTVAARRRMRREVEEEVCVLLLLEPIIVIVFGGIGGREAGAAVAARIALNHPPLPRAVTAAPPTTRLATPSFSLYHPCAEKEKGREEQRCGRRSPRSAPRSSLHRPERSSPLWPPPASQLRAPPSAAHVPKRGKGERSGAAAAAHPAPLRLLLASLWQLGAPALLQVEGEIERIERDKGSSEDDM